MTHLTVQHTITHSSDFFAATIDDEIVMINIEHGMYYRLNDVGSIIWAQLAEPKKIDDLCTHLVSLSNVAQEQCEQDVLDFLSELLDYGMLEVSHSQH